MSTESRSQKKINYTNPRKYVVLVINDEETTFDFVAEVLVRFFDKTLIQAETLTKQVHEEGRAIAGVYSKEIATYKIAKVLEEASKMGYPLNLEMEPE